MPVQVTKDNLSEIMNMICRRATVKDGVLTVETFETDKDLLKQIQRLHKQHDIKLTFIILRRKHDNADTGPNQTS